MPDSSNSCFIPFQSTVLNSFSSGAILNGGARLMVIFLIKVLIC